VLFGLYEQGSAVSVLAVIPVFCWEMSSRRLDDRQGVQAGGDRHRAAQPVGLAPRAATVSAR
jgi:hypothetical protein